MSFLSLIVEGCEEGVVRNARTHIYVSDTAKPKANGSKRLNGMLQAIDSAYSITMEASVPTVVSRIGLSSRLTTLMMMAAKGGKTASLKASRFIAGLSATIIPMTYNSCVETAIGVSMSGTCNDYPVKGVGPSGPKRLAPSYSKHLEFC